MDFYHTRTGTRGNDNEIVSLESFNNFSRDDSRIFLVAGIIGWLATAGLVQWYFDVTTRFL